MADVSFVPSFHHDPWVDRRDRCVADGSNGFNVRFEAIEGDLRGLSTVFGQINTALAAIASVEADPLPVANVVTFTPTLLPIVNVQEAQTTDTGLVTVFASIGGSQAALANFAPPDGVTLTGIRVVGDFSGLLDGEAEFFITVSRVPIRLTNPPAAPVTIASLTIGFQPQHYDTVMTVSPANAPVDLNTFRYFLSVGGVDLSGNGNTSTVEFVQLQFTRPT